jgi:hypothetical protein
MGEVVLKNTPQTCKKPARGMMAIFFVLLSDMSSSSSISSDVTDYKEEIFGPKQKTKSSSERAYSSIR